MAPQDIIIQPLVTERSMDQMEDKKYSFKVYVKANKSEIKKAVEKLFDVQVEKVNTIRMPGKKRRMGVHTGKTSDWKKAIVTLTKESKTIEFFEGL